MTRKHLARAERDAYISAARTWLAETYARATPRGSAMRYLIEPQDLLAADRILAAHPDRERKVGEELPVAFVIYRAEGTLHLAAVLSDGSLARLRAMKPWAAPSERQRLLGVMRQAIRPQILDERSALAARGVTTCAECGVEVGLEGELDHSPIPFTLLADTWLDGRHVPLTRVALDRRSVGCAHASTRMADSTQVASWSAFHQAHAQLRLTCTACNRAAGDHGARELRVAARTDPNTESSA